MACLFIDIAHIVVARGELQNAADSAALAGASALYPYQVNGVGGASSATLSAAGAAARTQARKFSALNSAGSVSVTIPASLDSDIVVGYQDATSTSNPNPVLINTSTIPNAVQVTVRRDSTANNPMPLFFSFLTSSSSWSGTATATAAVQGNNITTFKSVAGVNGKLLPIAVDVSYWNTLLANGNSPDGVNHDAYKVTFPSPNPDGTIPAGTVTSGSDNIPELSGTYPDSVSTGNFGLVDIGPDANDTPTFGTWIDSGPSSTDIQSLLSTGKLPASPSSPKQWKGGPGLKSTLVSNLTAAIGETRVVPLFSSSGGSGGNAYYNIVGFAGITIVAASASGSNIQFTIQPANVVDLTAVSSPTTGSAAITGGSNFVYGSSHLKLTN
jgi:hypothetical protein